MVIKKILLVLFVVWMPILAFSQTYVIHTDLIGEVASNTAYRLGRNSISNSNLKTIGNYRTDVLSYSIAIEEVQRITYNSLVNVNGAVLDSKSLYYTTLKIPKIVSNVAEIVSKSAQNPMLVPLARKTQQNLIARVMNLQDFLNNVLLKSDKDNLIDPITRRQLVNSVYTEITIIHNFTEAILRKFKLYTIQKAVNEIIPIFTWVNQDKAVIADIMRKFKM